MDLLKSDSETTRLSQMLTGLGCEFTTASIVFYDEARPEKKRLDDLSDGPGWQAKHRGDDVESAGTLGQ